MEKKKYAVIVAGGSGTRMGSSIPKQFLLLNERPILMHTLEAFYKADSEIQLILVLPESEFPVWEELCLTHRFQVPFLLQKGGRSRADSVENGLELISGDGLVAIHDGVRPFVDVEMIEAGFELAESDGNGVAAVALKDSVRMVDGEKNWQTDRSKLRLIQTPQTFRVNEIKEAYAEQDISTVTDDASVAEKAGYAIHLYEGSYENIKITTPEDLYIAEAILAKRKKH